MKEFVIYVEGMGFAVEYTIKAKDLVSAKRKAKAKAIKEFKSTLTATNLITYKISLCQALVESRRGKPN